MLSARFRQASTSKIRRHFQVSSGFLGTETLALLSFVHADSDKATADGFVVSELAITQPDKVAYSFKATGGVRGRVYGLTVLATTTGGQIWTDAIEFCIG